MKKRNGSESGLANLRTFTAFLFCSLGISLAMISFGAPVSKKTSTTTTVDPGVVPTISQPLRDLPTVSQLTAAQTELSDTERKLAGRQTPNASMHDSVVQTTAAAAVMPPVGTSFEGMNIHQGCGGCLPPDTNGAVGPNHYVQMVNTELAVFDKKTGAMISGPTPINALWSSGACSTHDDGDPIVIYDQLADRWLISQFTSSADPSYAQCVAVSTSPDPTGTYYA